MSRLGSYKNTAFNESQKFLVLDPSTSSASLVLASELVAYITPQIGSVKAESTRLSAENTDYKVGEIIQTSGATVVGSLASVYLVVAGGAGDFPMLNGNDLLVLIGDDALRSQLISQTAGQGASLVSMENGPTVEVAITAAETAILNRVIRVSSIAEIEALTGTPEYQVSLSGSRAGLFEFDPSDLSAQVTADAQQGLYIAPSSDATGASGAWARQLSSSGVIAGVLVDWFGGVNDSVADSGPAIQAANDWLEKEGRVGGILFFGKGGYKSFQQLRVGGWVTWRGAGAFSTSLLFDSALNADLILLGPDESGEFAYSGSYVFGARIEDMDINAGDVYRGLGKAVIFTNGAHQDSGIARCNIRGFRSTGININDGIGGVAGFHIEDVNFQSGGAPDLGTKHGIISNAGGQQLNVLRCQFETDGAAPFDSCILMLKDHLLAENVHFEGAANGIQLSQNEATIRTVSIIGATGRSDVDNLVQVASTNNVEYTLQSVNNTTITATDIKALRDNDSGTIIGGVGGASIANYCNVNRLGGNNIAHATVNYSQSTSAINGGFGVSSVVRNSIGDFTVTYDQPVKNQNVVAPCSVRLSAGVAGMIVPSPLSVTQINLKTYNASGTLTDPDRFFLSVFDG
jgi:hypothetical protein